MKTQTRAFVSFPACGLIAIAFRGCVAKRTVTRNGSVQSEG
jgi:hypothetical protein